MFCLHIWCHISPGFIRKVIDFELELQDKHNTCALSKHIGNKYLSGYICTMQASLQDKYTLFIYHFAIKIHTAILSFSCIYLILLFHIHFYSYLCHSYLCCFSKTAKRAAYCTIKGNRLLFNEYGNVVHSDL
jgi:hypothetical protein